LKGWRLRKKILAIKIMKNIKLTIFTSILSCFLYLFLSFCTWTYWAINVVSMYDRVYPDVGSVLAVRVFMGFFIVVLLVAYFLIGIFFSITASAIGLKGVRELTFSTIFFIIIILAQALAFLSTGVGFLIFIAQFVLFCVFLVNSLRTARQ